MTALEPANGLGPIRSNELLDMLERKFPPPHYIVMREVRDATGFDAVRSADAMAVGLYRSRGRSVIGFEVKVSRNDLQRELKKPEKAESLARYCDQWYLVLSDVGIADGLDIPETWGILAPKGKRLHCFKVPETMEPLPYSKIFLTALVKAAMDATAKPLELDIKARIEAGADEAITRHKKRHSYEMESYAKLKTAVAEFEKASGIQIAEYSDGKKLGETVQAVITGRALADRWHSDLAWHVEAMERVVKNAREVLGRVKPADEKVAEQ